MVSYKFAYKVRIALSVMPVETGIQTILKHWIPGRASYRQLARNDNALYSELRYRTLVEPLNEILDRPTF